MNTQGKNRPAFIKPRLSRGGQGSKSSVFRSGCLYPFLGFLVIFGAYGFLLRLFIPDPVVPFVFGLFTSIGTGTLITGLLVLFRSRKLGTAIRRDREGAPRKDGRFEAASGTIHPLQEPLVSPFQGRPCVAYEYDVGAVGKDNQTAGSDAWGWALTPSVIKAADGDQRLLGFPELEKFDQAVVGVGGRERINDFFKNTSFETIGERAFNKALGQILERSADDDGQARTDILRGSGLNPQAPQFEGHQWTERVVPVGEEVTAFGIYSAARSGLVPHPRKAAEAIQLWPGKGDGLMAVIEKEASGRLALGIVLFFVTHAFVSIVFFIMWLKGSL